MVGLSTIRRVYLLNWASEGRMIRFAQEPLQARGGGSPNSRKCADAFTLMELIVVIAIIAILAGLLLSALSKAQASSDRAVCISNQRQMALALSLFVDDNGVYPLMGTMSGVGQRSRVWYHDLEQYTGSKWPAADLTGRERRTGLFCCPSYNRVSGRYTGLSKAGADLPLLPLGSYGYNFHGVAPMIGEKKAFGLGGEILIGPPAKPEDIRAIRENEVRQPSDMIALGDSVLAQVGGWKGLLVGVDDLSYGLQSASIRVGFLPHVPRTPGLEPFMGEIMGDVKAMNKRHNGSHFVAFCDGHVEGRKIKAMFDLTNDDIRKSWNNDNAPHREKLPPNFR